MSKIHIIGKIFLNTEFEQQLKTMGVEFIARDNPKERSDRKEILKRVSDAEVVINNISTPLDAETLKWCPNLKFIQTWSTGVDNIDIEYCRNHGIKVCNVKNFSTDAVAEQTVGLMLLAAGRLDEAHQDTLKGNWNYQGFIGTQLKDKTVVIIGHGVIGKRVENILKAFKAKVVTLNSKTSERELENALKSTDFVTLHCPYNSSTHHLLNQKKFDLMKDVVLINCSRGGVVDELALVNALNSKKIKYACIDVFEKEPPTSDNKLLHHPKVFVTPHCTWNTVESIESLSRQAIENVRLHLEGKLDMYVV